MQLNENAIDLPRPFGPYTLLRRLAVGGMAEVYTARVTEDDGDGKVVAIKVLHPRHSEDEYFVRLLIEEGRIAMLLRHPNIVPTFDVGHIDETYFIAMEYVEGADAYRLVRRTAEKDVALPLDVCAYVIAEICKGLEYAHHQRDDEGRPMQIVHRDVSPHNVLIGFGGDVKLADFGIAKAALRSAHTDAGVIRGKYHYMSPEQARGEPLDHRTDIFSAGVVLYELLTGEMLYDEENIPAVLDRIRVANIEPPSSRRNDIPPSLDAIAMKALAKRREARFASARDFGRALEAFAAGATTSPPERLAEIMSRTLEPTIEMRRDDPSLRAFFDAEPGSRESGPAPVSSSRRRGRADPTARVPLRENTTDRSNAPPPGRRISMADGDEATLVEPRPHTLDELFMALPRSEQAMLPEPHRGHSTLSESVPHTDASEDFPTQERRISAKPQSAAPKRPSVAPPQVAPHPMVYPQASASLHPPPQLSTARYAAMLRPKIPVWVPILIAVAAALALGVVALAALLAPGPAAPVLEVLSVPSGAQVRIDEQPVAGVTPVKVRTGLEAGRTYRLTLELRDYQPWTSTFEAQHGRVQQIAVLTPRRAVLRVDTAPPRAHVWVDGVLRGIAPIEIQDLPPGQPIDVRASKPGYLETRQRVEIAVDDLSPAVTIVLPRKRR